MLEHEEDVEDHREETETKLCWITKDSGPIIIVVRDENHLNYAEGTSGEI